MSRYPNPVGQETEEELIELAYIEEAAQEEFESEAASAEAECEQNYHE